MKNQTLYIFLVTVVFYFACQSKIEETKYLPKEKMVQIITEMEFVKAAITYQAPESKADQEKMFEMVYQTHQISKSQFEESLKYYSKKPKELEDIYNSVISILTENQATNKY